MENPSSLLSGMGGNATAQALMAKLGIASLQFSQPEQTQTILGNINLNSPSTSAMTASQPTFPPVSTTFELPTITSTSAPMITQKLMKQEPQSPSEPPKGYEEKIERITADGHLNDRTIRKYRALAIEFEEFLDMVSDDKTRSWREVFTENIHTMQSSNDPIRYDEAQNSMRKVLTSYLANLKAPDGRTYGASSYCVRRSAIRWYVEREYGYEMSRTRGWNNIFKLVHNVKNNQRPAQPPPPKIQLDSASRSVKDFLQAQAIKRNNSNAALSNMINVSLATHIQQQSAMQQAQHAQQQISANNFLPYLKNQLQKTSPPVRNNSPKLVPQLSAPMAPIITSPVVTPKQVSKTASPISSGSTSMPATLTEEDVHRIYELFYAKEAPGVANVFNNPYLLLSYLWFHLTSYFTRYLHITIDETLKVSDLYRTVNGLTLSAQLLSQSHEVLEQGCPEMWPAFPIITDPLFLKIYDGYMAKRQASQPRHPDYTDPGKFFLLPIAASFTQSDTVAQGVDAVPMVAKVLPITDSERWFTCCPQSKHTVSNIMPNICILAKLSKCYSNFSVRLSKIDFKKIAQAYEANVTSQQNSPKMMRLKREYEEEHSLEIASNGASEDTTPSTKRMKHNDHANDSQTIVSPVANREQQELLKQVVENQKANQALLERVLNNQTEIESKFEGLLGRLEDIEKVLPKLKVQSKRRAVMCRRGTVTIRWQKFEHKRKRTMYRK